jgi:hypothetical protein
MTVLRYSNFKLRARLLAGDEPAWLRKHPRRSYIVQCVLATPPWTDLNRLRDLGRRAKALTERTGIEHVVDHCIPLNHKYVCGLNVPSNLTITTRAANAAKSNHWTECHGELFAEPEQFSLWPESILNTLTLRPQVVTGGGGVGVGGVGDGQLSLNRHG